MAAVLLLLLLLWLLLLLLLLTLGAHAREGYSSRPVCLSVCLSVCHTLILEITDN